MIQSAWCCLIYRWQAQKLKKAINSLGTREIEMVWGKTEGMRTFASHLYQTLDFVHFHGPRFVMFKMIAES
jgi:hypothetical protein